MSRNRPPPGQPLGQPLGPPPDEHSLRQAALAHLARYSTTQAGLLRVLERRVARWIRAGGTEEAAATASAAARTVVARLAEVGAVDDAAFAAGRTRSLQRAGRSRRAITAALQAKGVPAALAAVPEDPAAELRAALLYCARRRMGPFRPAPDADAYPRDLARLARAGFLGPVARQVLALSPATAEEQLAEARRA